MDSTLLITLTGRDRPGVTAALTESLAECGVIVVDIEQIVIRGRLTLGLLVAPGPTAEADCLEQAASVARATAQALAFDVDTVSGGRDLATAVRGRLTVTAIGMPMLPASVSALARRIASLDGNIERIRRVASYPVTAIEFEITGADLEAVRSALAEEASAIGLDVSVQRAGLARRGAHLVVMDVDSTLIQDEVIELIAAQAGVEDAVAQITDRAMRGEIDFAASLEQRVALLAGLEAKVLEKVRDQVRLTPGARTLVRTLSRMGYHVALVSGGFIEVVQPIAEDLGIRLVRANRLEVKDGRLTGRVEAPILDREGKALALREFAASLDIPLERTVGVGDGANDLDMLAAAGLGIAFNAKPLVRAAADAAVNVPFLDAILYLLGITREQVEEADADAGITTPAPPV
jgi:phosphoserine phosphatase